MSAILTQSVPPPDKTGSARAELDLVLLPASSRAEAMQIWTTLEIELHSRRMMCSAIWTETWLNHFGKQIPHQFAVGYRDGIPCGICLMTSGIDDHNGPVRLRTWHIGTAGEAEDDSTCVEYNTVLVRPEDRDEFQLAIWNWITARNDWDEFRLDGFSEEIFDSWLKIDPNFIVSAKTSRFFDLDPARQTDTGVLASLGSQTRAVIRQNLRRLGTVKTEWAETVADAEQIFHDLIRLHQIRWKYEGLPGCYASRAFREFHFELLHKLVPLGRMGLFRASNQQGTVGCAQVLMDENRACLYQGGRVLAEDRRDSPGLIVDYLLIEECLKRGYAAVDFLAGESAHKRRLSTSSAPLIWAVCRRPSLTHLLIDGLRSIKRAIEGTFPKKPSSKSTNASSKPDTDKRHS